MTEKILTPRRMILIAAIVQAIAFLLAGQLAHSQSLREFGGALLGHGVRSLANDGVSRQFQSDLERTVDNINGNRNRRFRPFQLPAGAVVTVEVDENNTRFQSRKLAAAVKDAIQDWGSNIRIGVSFEDRENLRGRNAADRDNPELRNPTPAGRAYRAAWDIHVVAREAYGFNNLNVDTSFFRSLSIFRLIGSEASMNVFNQVRLLELEIEVRKADTQLASPGGIISVVGSNRAANRISGDLATRNFNINYGSESGSDGDGDLRDALRRATQVFLGYDGNRRRN